ncbi:unnamed protein product [Prorocentrum cordatum]|uniref:Uncharacterized protein n=1 Tax=Prorocentrum cordatum TaxID=2364126 RepID=A0ABN9T106_9DINO|nr:unnamed protein product [Polarella glacialis]
MRRRAVSAGRESARAAHAAAPVPDLDATPKPRRPQPPLSARSRDSGFSCYQGLSAVEHLRWEMQASSEQCRMAVRTELGPLTEVLCDHIASAVNQTVTEACALRCSQEQLLARRRWRSGPKTRGEHADEWAQHAAGKRGAAVAGHNALKEALAL